MKNEQNGQLLTPELYMEISQDKSSVIANLKQKRTATLLFIKEELEKLKSLKEEKKEINKKIKCSKRMINKDRIEKFKLSRELNKQKRLSNSLNRIIIEEEPYISVSDFYPERKSTKKR